MAPSATASRSATSHARRGGISARVQPSWPSTEYAVAAPGGRTPATSSGAPARGRRRAARRPRGPDRTRSSARRSWRGRCPAGAPASTSGDDLRRQVAGPGRLAVLVVDDVDDVPLASPGGPSCATKFGRARRRARRCARPSAASGQLGRHRPLPGDLGPAVGRACGRCGASSGYGAGRRRRRRRSRWRRAPARRRCARAGPSQPCRPRWR